ncbi:hypothetical protein BH23PLA1_BH23PLA1_15960 [soil metagenome]
MSIELSQQAAPTPAKAREGWMSRWFSTQSRRSAAPRASASEPIRSAGAGTAIDLTGGSIREVTRRLLAQDRYIFVLLKAAADHIDSLEAAPARKTMEGRMALVPGGLVPVVQSNGELEMVEVPAFFLDRHAVTNRQFQKFVDAGGYDALEIWPQEVWPSLMRFADRTGRPGPADWQGGRFPKEKAEHPVVGVTWYEALAYARWAGKRLPIAAEWQKAGGWPEHLSGGSCNRYPWGDLFDPRRANTAAANVGSTVPVEAFPGGDTPNGIRQMSGNVWEWLDDPLESIPCQPGEMLQTWKPMRRIVGGAFNTYLPGEVTCHFVTGQGELDRRPNIGFRCAIAADQLRDDL